MNDENHCDGGAVLVQPEGPPRGTFTLLVPYNTTWSVKASGAALRLDFRPMTPGELATELRLEREVERLAKERRMRLAGFEAEPSTRQGEEEAR
jgi:hypothetical protein